MSVLGHNQGPTMAKAVGWQKHCWAAARKDLLPRLPIEVIRRRIRRAGELGLDYKSYASIRATSGHDVVAFLFSSNALRLLKKTAALPQDRVEKLKALHSCGRLVAVQLPLMPDDMRKAAQQAAVNLDTIITAPDLSHTWGQTRAVILSALAPLKLPADRVVAIGDTTLERDWCTAGRLAGYITADQYFSAATGP